MGGGIHCQQARFLAECAADIVKRQLPDKQSRLDWMVTEAKSRDFNLRFTLKVMVSRISGHKESCGSNIITSDCRVNALERFTITT
jgi:hypothetical protein